MDLVGHSLLWFVSGSQIEEEIFISMIFDGFLGQKKPFCIEGELRPPQSRKKSVSWERSINGLMNYVPYLLFIILNRNVMEPDAVRPPQLSTSG